MNRVFGDTDFDQVVQCSKITIYRCKSIYYVLETREQYNCDSCVDKVVTN